MFAGIDIGLTTIKVVLLNDNCEVIDSIVNSTGSLFYKNAQNTYAEILKKNNLTQDNIKYCVVTGYGRKLYKDANEEVNEISANASGAKFLNAFFPGIKTIINIGGQDSKVISLDSDFNVENFVMNDKCAAGTGKFMEMAALSLEIEVDRLTEYHLNASKIELVNSTCAVFAESEIITLLASGKEKPNIVAGIHYSIARRIKRLAKNISLKSLILFDGGAAFNLGLKDALEYELGNKIIVAENPQITSAIGAALIAYNSYQKKLKSNIS
jgi:(R)-2-hydroxyacyl-CoA dehydratese activating ATPase